MIFRNVIKILQQLTSKKEKYQLKQKQFKMNIIFR
jgi:hypothetical protein